MFLSWIIKENILNKNLKKIQPPNEDSFGIKAFKFFVSSIVEVALSWIGVTVNVFHIMIRLLKALREILVSTPEDIRLLRFPLRNNPNLSREAVWAYLNALNVKIGADSVNAPNIVSHLNELCDYYPSTDKNEELAHLKRLNVIDESIITAALDNLSVPNDYIDTDPDDLEDVDADDIEISALSEEEDTLYAKETDKVSILCRIAECHLDNLDDEYESNKLNERIQKAIDMAEAIPDKAYSYMALGCIIKLAHKAGLEEKKNELLSKVKNSIVNDSILSTMHD